MGGMEVVVPGHHLPRFLPENLHGHVHGGGHMLPNLDRILPYSHVAVHHCTDFLRAAYHPELLYEDHAVHQVEFCRHVLELVPDDLLGMLLGAEEVISPELVL